MAGRVAHLPINVLHVVADDDRRGAQVFAYELGEELRRRGVSVDTVGLTKGSRGGLPVDVLGPSRLHPRTLVRLRRAMRSAPVTVGFGSTTLPACTLAGGGPFVYRSIGELGRWATSPWQRLRVRAALRRTAGVIALWEGAAAAISDDFGIPRHHIHVIPRGVPADGFAPADPARRRAARAELGLTDLEDAPVLVSVGALEPEKALDRAIDAVTRLDGVHLLLAGSGGSEGALRRQAEDRLPGRVHFLGHLIDVLPALHAADAVILTSHTEGMPGALIEAAMAGLPAVATDVGAVREVVIDGETGCIVPRAATAEHLAAAATATLAQATRMGAAARSHAVDRFEIGRVATDWMTMVRKVAAA